MKSSKAAPKKGGLGFRGRKALNDIANKSSFHHEASSRKNNFRKEEKVLHDHKKCIEAQQKTVDTFYLDLVRPGRDSVCTAGPQDSKETENGSLLHVLQCIGIHHHSPLFRGNLKWLISP